MSGLDDLLAELGRCVALPFEQARTAPAGIYAHALGAPRAEDSAAA